VRLLTGVAVLGFAATALPLAVAAGAVSPGVLGTHHKTAQIYVSQGGSETVGIYDAAGNQVGQIGGFGNPAGLAVDRARSLYVADDLNDVVDVFAAGATSPSRVLQAGKNAPKEIAIGPGGSVYASDITDYPATITVWGHKGVKPLRTIEDGKVQSFSGIAFDAKGDLFAAWYVQGQGGIDEVPAGSTTPINLGVTGLFVPLGVKVDRSGNLLVADAGCGCVEIIPSGATAPASSIGGFMQPTELAFNATETLLYVSDAQAGDVAVINYKTGKVVSTITSGLSASNYPWGVAVSPAARN
jgi:YVTN family beta-propeller protein